MDGASTGCEFFIIDPIGQGVPAGWPTIRKLTCWVGGANPLTLGWQGVPAPDVQRKTRLRYAQLSAEIASGEKVRFATPSNRICWRRKIIHS